MELEKTYNPKETEKNIYTTWELGNYFKPAEKKTDAFSIVIPPPNVTGALHMGHALNLTLQDIIIRYQRMQNRSVLWLPGTDHAGIATQNVVERQLKKEGTDRHDIGRTAFVERVWEWKKEYGNRIMNQIRRLGASVDWSREQFTMNDQLAASVIENFVTLYHKGLIYKGNYIINWCPRCQTALSDIEVNHVETNGHLWHIQYSGDSGSVIIATTRPETMFGDTAIAVHPDDKRYQSLIGKTVTIPLTTKKISIIADDKVDQAFGTGAVKVTPAHDLNDFEIGNRHQLERVLIMTETGIMNENAPKQYQGMDRYDCRKQLIQDLTDNGFLIKTQDHLLSVGHCYRCQTSIEPYLSNQWFVDMKKLAGSAIEVVKTKQIQFVPERWEKLYFDWMESIRDWCISRQIWWGHQIPVWYCENCPDKPIVTQTPPTQCPHCQATKLTQDPDVLDTWFSSALWPFATLGWPNTTPDLEKFYPTSVLVTGYDILTFWVSRMIVMGLEQTQQIPFHTVYIHGLVRDMHGKKMSKSSGNVIDPLELIEEYGADALRFTLASLCTLGGQDIKFSFDKINASRNFSNKIWNVTRYILMSLEKSQSTVDLSLPIQANNISSQWIISLFHSLLEEVNHSFTQYNFAHICELLWEFTWNKFCDWYIEMSKIEDQINLPVLFYILTHLLKLLHPFMPFLTEEIWNHLQNNPNIQNSPSTPLIIESWPQENAALKNAAIEQEMEIIIRLIREVRNLRKQLNLQPQVKNDLILIVDAGKESLLQKYMLYIQKLSKAKTITITTNTKHKPDKASASVIEEIQIYIPLEGLIDKEKESLRLQNTLKTIEQDIDITQKKLSNETFLSKAPEMVINKIKAQNEKLLNEKKLVEFQLNELV